MMHLGFVSAIFPDLSLEKTLDFAAKEGFSCVEAMCWPKGRADRRYAGVTHVEVEGFSRGEANRINDLLAEKGVSLSGLGYYPNPLAADRAEGRVYINHIKKTIRAAEMLGLEVVNTFVGRDPGKTVDENWPRFLQVWQPLVEYAEDHGIKIGIENCPMIFGDDEWPGGKNLASTPEIWRRMFDDIPSPNFGLNYDPSHPIWLHIDEIRPISEFGSRFVHVHAKDARIDLEELYQRGVMGHGWHTPKLPGLGDVNWSKFFSALTDVGYKGAVAIEVEDRAYEGTLKARKHSLRQSKRYLEQFQF